MSAYVAYDLTAVNRHGVVLGRFSTRAVSMPDRDTALELARERYGDEVAAVDCVRTPQSRIGKITPACRRYTVSARVKVMG